MSSSDSGSIRAGPMLKFRLVALIVFNLQPMSIYCECEVFHLDLFRDFGPSGNAELTTSAGLRVP